MRLRVNVKKTKIMISSENAGKVTIKGTFSCAVCRKGVYSNLIPYQFCRCWVHKRCSGIRGKLKEDSKFKCHTFGNQQTDTAMSDRINGQSLEIVKRFYYLMQKNENNDARIVWWMYNVRPEDRISAEELRTSLKLKRMRECLQEKILQ